MLFDNVQAIGIRGIYASMGIMTLALLVLIAAIAYPPLYPIAFLIGAVGIGIAALSATTMLITLIAAVIATKLAHSREVTPANENKICTPQITVKPMVPNVKPKDNAIKTALDNKNQSRYGGFFSVLFAPSYGGNSNNNDYQRNEDMDFRL
jgi:hypothetical protein